MGDALTMAMGLWHPSIHTKLRATVGRHHNRCQPPSYEVVLLPGHWRPGEQLPDQCGRVLLRVHEGSRRLPLYIPLLKPMWGVLPNTCAFVPSLSF